MNQNTSKTVLILGANSDVAKQCIIQYLEKGFSVIAASRNTKSLEDFITSNNLIRIRFLFYILMLLILILIRSFIPDFL
jgi:NADP-dependent 3-hydroxy acid dehydrogenase YdfG